MDILLPLLQGFAIGGAISFINQIILDRSIDRVKDRDARVVNKAIMKSYAIRLFLDFVVLFLLRGHIWRLVGGGAGLLLARNIFLLIQFFKDRGKPGDA